MRTSAPVSGQVAAARTAPAITFTDVGGAYAALDDGDVGPINAHGSPRTRTGAAQRSSAPPWPTCIARTHPCARSRGSSPRTIVIRDERWRPLQRRWRRLGRRPQSVRVSVFPLVTHARAHARATPSPSHHANRVLVRSVSGPPSRARGARRSETDKHDASDRLESNDKHENKRQHHVVSEHRRRLLINEGFDHLERVLPNTGQRRASKPIVIQKAVLHVRQLQANRQLIADETAELLRRLDAARLYAPHPTTAGRRLAAACSPAVRARVGRFGGGRVRAQAAGGSAPPAVVRHQSLSAGRVHAAWARR